MKDMMSHKGYYGSIHYAEICEFNERDALCQPAFPPVVMLYIPVTLLPHRGQA